MMSPSSVVFKLYRMHSISRNFAARRDFPLAITRCRWALFLLYLLRRKQVADEEQRAWNMLSEDSKKDTKVRREAMKFQASYQSCTILVVVFTPDRLGIYPASLLHGEEYA